MKKSVKPGKPAVSRQPVADIVELVIKMQEHLSLLDKKIEILISRTAERPFEVRSFSRPTQSFSGHAHQPSSRPQASRPDNAYSQRTLHKAVCADCNNQCEVPFKPTGDRPVYCKECFAKRKNSGSQFMPKRDERSGEVAAVQEKHFSKGRHTSSSSGFAKKRPYKKSKHK